MDRNLRLSLLYIKYQISTLQLFFCHLETGYFRNICIPVCIDVFIAQVKFFFNYTYVEW